LGGQVWRDEDGDGLQTAGEPYVPGVRVLLYRSDGDPFFEPEGDDVPLALRVTLPGGAYAFTNLCDGGYHLQVDPRDLEPGNALSGLMATLRDAEQDGQDERDSDADRDTLSTRVVRATPGTVDFSWDFGFVLDPNAGTPGGGTATPTGGSGGTATPPGGSGGGTATPTGGSGGTATPPGGSGGGTATPIVTPEPCAPCREGLREIELRYTGSDPAWVTAVIDKGLWQAWTPFSGYLEPGQTFKLQAEPDRPLGGYVSLKLDGVTVAIVNLRCGKPIGPGKRYGAHFEVVAGRSLDGTPLCPIEQP
jgi:hypothetical protein